jgi:hypothetical protein
MWECDNKETTESGGREMAQATTLQLLLSVPGEENENRDELGRWLVGEQFWEIKRRVWG